jgi:large subunit ribosomal protein L6
MSRVGKKPIEIPEGVTILLEERKIEVKGKFGKLEQPFSNLVSVEKEGQTILVKPLEETKKARSYHGLMRALIQNMILGVQNYFQKTLIAEGVGYKFQLEKEKLILNVGFSHPVFFVIPSDLSVQLESNTKIKIQGIEKERVGFFASQIRGIRPPEPYKGKGIQYQGEKILRKVGKTGK